jgi:hypothetical protein
MDITKSREEFEKWLTSEYYWGADTLDKAYFQGDYKTGYYIGGEFFYEGSSCGEALFWAWRGWQASRESIEVELPMRLSPCRSGYGYTLIPNDIGEALEYDNVVKALRTAGIRIKGESE